MRFNTVVLVFLLAAVPAQSLGQTLAARVAGRVIDAVSGEPIDGVRVTLTIASAPAAPSGRPLSTTTNPDGAFVMTNVPPGRWEIQVQKTGFYVAGDNAQDRIIDVAASVALPDVLMDRGGSLSGRVIDPRGRTVSDVLVAAISRGQLPDGVVRSIGRIATVQTNDVGEFRLAGLAPGDYYIVARPRPVPQTMNSQPARTTVYLQTYHPGVADLSQGTVFTVTRGIATSILDLPLLAVPAYQVSGIAVDANGRPAPGATVILMPASLTATLPLSVTAQADGTFRIVNVPAGRYRIAASLPVARTEGGVSSNASSTPGDGRPALLDVVVNDADITGVYVPVQQR